MAKSKNKIVVEEVNVKKLNYQQRFELIAKMIRNGYTKKECIDYVMANFVNQGGEYPDYEAAYTMYRQAFGYIYQQSRLDKEELRALNLQRLEELYDDAMEEGARLSDKIKVIDTIGKMANLYQTDVKLDQADTTFRLAVDLDNAADKPKTDQ